ncbi:macrophage mannose receptor 1 [Elysia marginata]|uniref:Macrophage mannose receptor 1 n=1 Tax=Elysia marginata TaxID=1093978 RepID=A0AAV4IIA3_9GAST|nr:macrophage mannose receptor 1 [Elysia marginata]
MNNISNGLDRLPALWPSGGTLAQRSGDRCRGEYSLSSPLVLPYPTVTASSSMGHPRDGKEVRLPLNTDVWGDAPAWMPQPVDQTPWIQVTFSTPRIVRGVTMLGDKSSGKYVSKFQLQLSPTVKDLDKTLLTYNQPYGIPHTFSGSQNATDAHTIYLASSVVVQVVRVVLLDWPPQGAALKFDVISCKTGCRSEPSLENIPAARLSASDSLDRMTPDRSRLNAIWSGHLRDGWSPRQNTKADSSYIQVDLGSIKQVTAVATQGSMSAQAWVRSFYLAFSLDGKVFRRRGEKQSMLYQGNLDSVSVVKNELQSPVNARFVQLWPHEFHSSIALRWEVFTCPKHSAASPVGCYLDDPSDPDFKVVPPRDQFSSTWPEACLAQCYDLGYPYAGLQNGDKCSCGHDYGTYGPTDQCDLPCQAPYTNFKCGGVDKNTVFSTGIGGNSTECPQGYHPFKDSCYALVIETSTWLDARSRCVKFGGHLVTIGDSEENQVVTGLLGGKARLPIRRSNTNILQTSSTAYSQVPILPDGTWSNAFSEGLYPFVCETGKRSSSAPRASQQDSGCQMGWLGFRNKCYQLNRVKKTWHEAKSLCRMEQAYLAHIEDLQENIFLTKAMVESTSRYWTGVFAQNNEYRQDVFNLSSAVSFTNWAVLKPDITGGCVSLGTAHHAGEWANQACTTTNSFVCEAPRVPAAGGLSPASSPSRPPTTTSTTVADSSCSAEWLDSGDGMCYQVNSVAENFKATWYEASEDCKNKGANLASFHNDGQFRSVLAKLRKFGSETGNFWCGLHNFDLSTGYEWSDQSVMNYVRWHASSRPGEGRCGEVRPVTGDMAMLDCLKHRSWVCAAPTGTKTIVPAVEVFPQPEKLGACDPLPRSWRKFKDSCYYLADGSGGSDDTLTWREARKSCSKDGADLVSIDTEEENRFLLGLGVAGHISNSRKACSWVPILQVYGQGKVRVNCFPEAIATWHGQESNPRPPDLVPDALTTSHPAAFM